jgi:transcription elongation factor Elf1
MMLLVARSKRLFPCPICCEGLEVRQSKKGKPYVVCDRCGLQMFVRTEPGIRRFEKLVADAESKNTWERLTELEQRYQKKCPKCGKRFWVTEKLIETGWFDGAFAGYRCPEEDCGGMVCPEEDQ